MASKEVILNNGPAGNMPFEQLCRQMAIVDGPDEYIKPRNAGILFFNDDPQKFIPLSQIEVVEFPTTPGGDRLNEKIFQDFITILEIHPGVFKEIEETKQESEQESEQVIKILEFCKTERKKQEILAFVGLTNDYKNYQRNILPLVQKGLLRMKYPGNPKHPNQRYLATELGLEAALHDRNIQKSPQAVPK